MRFSLSSGFMGLVALAALVPTGAMAVGGACPLEGMQNRVDYTRCGRIARVVDPAGHTHLAVGEGMLSSLGSSCRPERRPHLLVWYGVRVVEVDRGRAGGHVERRCGRCPRPQRVDA